MQIELALAVTRWTVDGQPPGGWPSTERLPLHAASTSGGAW
jgi:hypothetical protein